MPYIPQAERENLLLQISELRFSISKDPQKRPGQLNFTISQLISLVYGEKLRYHEYNEIIGVLESAKLELYRSRVAPYEDEKKDLNGPLL